MITTSSLDAIPQVGDGSGLEPEPRIYPEELQLAFRNHSVLLEGLRFDRTPTGMHYTLTHYDVPYVDSATWRLTVHGEVERSFSLDLAELQYRPSVTLRMTLECAGDGRALLQPRPVAQPWLVGAVGTADWTGTPLRGILEEAGILSSAREVLFTGLDRGIEGGVEQDYQRSLSMDEALRDDVLLAWSMNDTPLEPQHGAPLRLIVPGWYGMTHVKWLRSIEVLAEPFTGYQHVRAYRYSQTRDEPGEPVTSGFDMLGAGAVEVNPPHLQVDVFRKCGVEVITRADPAARTDASKKCTHSVHPHPHGREFRECQDVAPGSIAH